MWPDTDYNYNDIINDSNIHAPPLELHNPTGSAYGLYICNRIACALKPSARHPLIPSITIYTHDKDSNLIRPSDNSWQHARVINILSKPIYISIKAEKNMLYIKSNWYNFTLHDTQYSTLCDQMKSLINDITNHFYMIQKSIIQNETIIPDQSAPRELDLD